MNMYKFYNYTNFTSRTAVQYSTAKYSVHDSDSVWKQHCGLCVQDREASSCVEISDDASFATG